VPVHPVERKLAAIFAADIAGYSRLMARDEVGTLARLKACRVIVDEVITSHRGRISPSVRVPRQSTFTTRYWLTGPPLLRSQRGSCQS
jgi:hypothetical protein